MKKYLLILLFLGIKLAVFAQKKDKVLFTINEKPTYVSEFYKLFKTDRATLNANSFEEDLQLMVDYKLKLKQAEIEKIDTLPALQQEFETYKNNIVSSYVTDKEMLNTLVKEAYERVTHKVEASHLLVAIKNNDTLTAYNKILDLKKQLANGADFEKLAVAHSDDKSAVKNKGYLGKFGAFAMVYPFESAAFNTPVGTISDIVKTQFGYHLIKVKSKIKAEPKVNVSHIMIAGLDADKKQQIDTLYQKLLAGKKFENLARKYSDDKGTSRKGGAIRPLGRGALPKAFEDVAFSLKKKKEFSKPFKTQYGWHIVQYRGLEEIKSFDKMKKDLKRKVMRDSRKEKVADAAYAKLEKNHKVVVNQEALKVFNQKNTNNLPESKLETILLSIDEEKYAQKDFAEYIKSRRNKKAPDAFKTYKRKKIKEYLKSHLAEGSLEVKETLESYKNGLVIFELMKNHVWDIPAKEKEKVTAFYNANKSKYNEKGDSFEKVKGYVESDYQEQVQKEWLQSLRDGNKIKMNKRQVKKAKKKYNK